MTTSAVKPSIGQLARDPVLLLAFGFGSGLAPKAPGTAGTLLAVLLFPLIAGLSPLHYLLFMVIVCLVGVAVCGRAAHKLGVHDHGGIVFDEFAGLWLAMFSFPATWPWLLAGFVVFRFFDIVKPWPIRWLDRRVGGGIGIMVDDLVAGVFTWLTLAGYRYFLG
ncbi:MAG: phosphatidylglycerophosphatase A [Porticoccaceae bacterium]|nr:phosphatidylglycerophosphatase A [Porticoccaceae bacterium]